MKPEEINKLPYYLDWKPDGRVVAVLPYYEGGRFVLPFIVEEQIKLLYPELASQSVYKAKEPAEKENDYYLSLLDITFQRLQFPRIIRKAEVVQSDIENFGFIIEKMQRLFHSRPAGFGTHFLIGTELEFLFYNVRSLYDGLQGVIKSIWEQTTLVDKSLKKQGLPNSFGDVVFYGEDDKIHSADEISQKYGLPAPIAQFYVSQVVFFKLCREIRNRIAHSGKSLNDFPIFQLDEGFSVDTTQYPFSGFNCWSEQTIKNEKLGSVLALTSYIALKAIESTEEFADALVSSIQLPPPIGADWHVFIRNPYIFHLICLEEYINSPWYAPEK